jgi:hypothetical protein
MKRQPKKKTLYNRRLSQKDWDDLKDIDYPPIRRPEFRGECEGGRRPCPFVSCRYHLYLDVTRTGSIVFNFEEEPWEIDPSCALDVAEDGDHILEDIAGFFSVCRERIRQIERDALIKLRWRGKIKDWRTAA